jgi:pyruvate formate lyase activating enzyme
VTSAAHKGEAADVATDAATEIVVGGLTPLSTSDWPGMLAATVFCQGCAWNCPYCHNAALRPFGPGERTWPEVLAWLTTRPGLLDAVVFSGGEPLLQPGLAEAMRQVRGLGFEVGLHTSGMAPQALERVLPLCGWVGLDLKAPRRAYPRITGAPGSAEDAWASLDLLRESGIPFELRTTWHPALLPEDELLELAGEIAAAGTPLWALQAFQPEGCADASLATAGRARVDEALVARLRAALGAGQQLIIRN